MPRFEFTEQDAKKTVHPGQGRVATEAGKEEERRINLFLPMSVFKRLRLFTAREDTTIKQVVTEALDQYLSERGVE